MIRRGMVEVRHYATIGDGALRSDAVRSVCDVPTRNWINVQHVTYGRDWYNWTSLRDCPACAAWAERRRKIAAFKREMRDG